MKQDGFFLQSSKDLVFYKSKYLISPTSAHINGNVIQQRSN